MLYEVTNVEWLKEIVVVGELATPYVPTTGAMLSWMTECVEWEKR
jgi:hypothetical protein